MSVDYDVWVCCDDCGEQVRGMHEDSDFASPDEDVEDRDDWAVYSIPREERDKHVWGGIQHVCPACCVTRGWIVEGMCVVGVKTPAT